MNGKPIAFGISDFGIDLQRDHFRAFLGDFRHLVRKGKAEPCLLLDIGLEEADILMTLRPYYRERQKVIVDAEEKGIPIYVLRSNTTAQIEYTLASMLKIEVQDQATNWEDVEEETISAIRSVLSGEVSWIDLSPADRSIRRIQQEMIEQANLVCQPFGKEPRRRLRIYRTA